MRDVLSLKFFIRDGRDHVEEWIGFLLGHSQLMFLVPVFQPGLTLEENVRNLCNATHIDQEKLGRHQRIKWYQRAYIYGGDMALLVLFGLEQNRKALVGHVQGVVEQYHQKGYVLWDGNRSFLATADGQTELPAFAGTLDSLDELAGFLIPGFRTSGQFDRSMSYVQMRDYQTRPRPGQDKSPQT